jgi:hypothetical protein
MDVTMTKSERARTHALMQHIWQAMFLAMAVWWGWYRQWYWVQAGFLVLRECDEGPLGDILIPDQMLSLV